MPQNRRVVYSVNAERIRKEMVDKLYSEGFTAADISRYLGVSARWFYLWVKQTNYQRPMVYLPLNNEGDAILDNLVLAYITGNPLIGEIMTWAHISSLGFSGKKLSTHFQYVHYLAFISTCIIFPQC